MSPLCARPSDAIAWATMLAACIRSLVLCDWISFIFGQGFVVFVDSFDGDFSFHLEPKKLD
jgi:hypothetical protein